MKTRLLFNILLFWLGCCWFISGPAAAQIEMESADKTVLYYYDIVTQAAQDTGLTELKLFVKIPYDELQFIRDADGFRARYELTVIVRDADGRQVQSRVQTRDVAVSEFEKTNAPYTYAFNDVSFDLEPETYTVLIAMTDMDSDQTGRHEVDLDLIDYWNFDFSMSDLILADTTYTDADGQFHLEPNVLWSLGGDSESLALYFEIYSTVSFDSIPVDVMVRDPDGRMIHQWKQTLSISHFRTPVLQTVPKSEISPGKYKLEIRVGRDRIETRRIKDLTIQWMNLPAVTSNLDKAIEQLRYIAGAGKINEMKKAEGDEKKELFEAFWDSVDPTPGTELNELMVEYYRRIEFANRHFTGYTEGWLTDRGLVYIVLGPPDDIERHPFEQDSKPYIVWRYYLRNRSFVFLDQSGFGDYRLQNPMWEVYSAR